MTKPFRDSSMFQGLKQFCDDVGNDFRAHYQANNTWDIFIRKSNDYYYDGTIRGRKTLSSRQIYSRYLELDNISISH